MHSGHDDKGRPLPGTDAALVLLLNTRGVDVESARKWLQDALGCLEGPQDTILPGNAANQTFKALVALGYPEVWQA